MKLTEGSILISSYYFKDKDKAVFPQDRLPYFSVHLLEAYNNRQNFEWNTVV